MKPTTVQDVLNSAGKSTTTPKTTLAKLGKIWVERIALEYNEDHAMIYLTNGDMMKLKTFMLKVGADKAVTILNRVLDDWLGFCSEVKEREAVKATPSYPNIGFLAKFSNVAMTPGYKPVVAVTPPPAHAVNCTDAFDVDAYLSQGDDDG